MSSATARTERSYAIHVCEMRLGCLCVVAVTACGRLHFDAVSDSGSVDSTGSGPFGTPMPVSQINDPLADDDPALSVDLLELVFDSERIDGVDGNLYVSRRTDATSPWSAPALITETMSASDEDGPNISPDGLTLTFSSNRLGGDDLFMSTRTSPTSAWSMPTVISELKTTSYEQDLSMTADGLFGVFWSDRLGNDDLFMTSRASTALPWDPPVPLNELNTTDVEEGPAVVPDGTAIVFVRDRGLGFEIYLAVRATRDVPFDPPTLLAELDLGSEETDPWLSPDRRTLVYTSGRYSARDIYIAVRP
jgi:Tol biopolymer transport system component